MATSFLNYKFKDLLPLFYKVKSTLHSYIQVKTTTIQYSGRWWRTCLKVCVPTLKTTQAYMIYKTIMGLARRGKQSQKKACRVSNYHGNGT